MAEGTGQSLETWAPESYSVVLLPQGAIKDPRLSAHLKTGLILLFLTLTLRLETFGLFLVANRQLSFLNMCPGAADQFPGVISFIALTQSVIVRISVLQIRGWRP